jgi:hypothetical protein
MINIMKNISLKTLDVLFSNGIIFLLNNLFYASHISYLDTRTRLPYKLRRRVLSPRSIQVLLVLRV